MADLVDLSNETLIIERNSVKKSPKRKTNLLPEYQGLGIIERAKKAANKASFNNPECWWVYDYVYRELTWRNSHAASRT